MPELEYKPLLESLVLIAAPDVFPIHLLPSVDGFLGFQSICRAVEFEQLGRWCVVERTPAALRRVCAACYDLAIKAERRYQAEQRQQERAA